MNEGFTTVREFDSAMEGLREDIHRLDKKFDQWIATKAEEAHMLGELCGKIDGLFDRVERAERDSQDNKALVLDLRKDMDRNNAGRLKWWGQFLLIAVSVGMTWIAGRLVK